jgi:hypothetical protein
MNKRPELNANLSAIDFKNFYWLKEELTAFCRSEGISTKGGKLELSGRIITYLQTGEVVQPEKDKASTSKFDWGKASLDVDTRITDNYKNTENVRAFMTKKIGSHFRFNTEFMEWTKQHPGKTMSDAISEWKRIYDLKKDKNYKTEIAPQFEYNTHIRSFLADNPGKTLKDAINSWKLKRNQS